MPFKRRQNIQAETITDNKVTENIKEYNYLGCSLLYINNNKIHIRLQVSIDMWKNLTHITTSNRR